MYETSGQKKYRYISYENRREHKMQQCLAELENEILEVFLNQPNHIKLISCFQESNNDQDCQPEEIKYTSLGRCGTRSRQHITNCRQSIDHSPACGIQSQFPPPVDHHLATDCLPLTTLCLQYGQVISRFYSWRSTLQNLHSYVFTKINVYEPVSLLLPHHRL